MLDSSIKSSPCLIDWINIQQKHNGLPDLHGGYFIELNDSEQENWRIAKHMKLEGSFSTAIMVRSFGGQVELRGNVGRWCRSDNVFNMDFASTIFRANEVVDCFGLPHFSDDGDFWTDKDGKIRSNGAAVTRLDLTRNYLTGSPQNAVAYMAWLDGLSLPYIRRGRAVGSTTIQWGSNTGRFKLIAYNKAVEMLAHAKNEEHRKAIQQSQIYQYCLEQGLVRVELKLGRLELEEQGLRYLGDINMEKLQALFDSKVVFLHTAKVRDELDLADLPHYVQLTYSSYMAGVDVTQILSNGTLYRHAKILRAFGVDILSAPNVAQLKTKVREITIQAAAVPVWYSLKAA
jgi:II/X family phage/plasmid replication protein